MSNAVLQLLAHQIKCFLVSATIPFGSFGEKAQNWITTRRKK